MGERVSIVWGWEILFYALGLAFVVDCLLDMAASPSLLEPESQTLKASALNVKLHHGLQRACGPTTSNSGSSQRVSIPSALGPGVKASWLIVKGLGFKVDSLGSRVQGYGAQQPLIVSELSISCLALSCSCLILVWYSCSGEPANLDVRRRTPLKPGI